MKALKKAIGSLHFSGNRLHQGYISCPGHRLTNFVVMGYRSDCRKSYCKYTRDPNNNTKDMFEDDEDIDPEVWDEDLEGEKHLDPKYEFPPTKENTKFYGFHDKKPPSDAELVSDDSDEEDLENFFSTDYKHSPFKTSGVAYEDWAELKQQYDTLPKKKPEDDFNQKEVRGDIPFEKWTELKRQFNMLPDEAVKELDYVKERGDRSGVVEDPTFNPNEERHYRTMPKEPESEERMRYYRSELDRYLRIINQWAFTPRFFSTDPHVERVKAKLAAMKPDPDGVYRNVVEVISDIDILLYAYRVVKARKLGPGTECTDIPIDNLKMDWFYETQKKLRDGTYAFKAPKVVYVKKKSFKKS